MELQSIVQKRGQVAFPEFTGERVYMRAFRKAEGLPADLARWQGTVDSMLDGVETDQEIYLMVDQSPVVAGVAQRRPGVHIDGYWVAGLNAHGGGGHRAAPRKGYWDSKPDWLHCDFSKPEGLILASDVQASRAFEGWYQGTPGDGGDFGHVTTGKLTEHRLRAGTVYAGNVTMLHESLPVRTDCLRTLVRLSVPGWSPTH